ncbi:hypothetical protein H6A19_13635 [Clostridium saudiense]|uniref:Uncharacterized protein n=1 Tax=Clostridium saudiense TaxID=1414720 RepID=A0ABS2FJJ9_9CLOT|nr:hypothetical protein [Clostridium saudiense]MBM6820359.1 hypothetical protein [Clostridium saudiense]
MELKVFEFLEQEVPSSVDDIREALDLLATSIDSAVEQIGEKVNISFANKDFKKVSELSLNSEELDSISKRIQEFIAGLDNIIDDRNIDEDSKKIEEIYEKSILNYSDYLVDTEIEHNLYEDLTHKRPYAFKIEDTTVGIKDWKGALIETINYLAKKDPNIIRSFIDDSKMNGKKVIYFSRVKLPTMRAAREIKSANIYVETNLSANGIRNLLIKILNKYNIKLSDYKIYLKADYSELH